MRKFVIFSSCFLFFITLNAQWTWQSPIPTGNMVKGVDFVDYYHGWAFDYYGALLSTSNGGLTWQVTTDTNYSSIDDLDFIDHNTGWIVGDKIRKTCDGGQSWVVQYQLQDSALLSIFFLDENLGWAAGEHGLILNTTDGGSTWHRQNSGNTQYLRQVFFSDALHGWALSSQNPMIFATTDGGETWFPQDLGLSGGYICYSIWFADNLHGWIGLEDVSDGGLILYTDDGGNLWSVQDTTASVVYSVCFSDSQHGIASGGGGKLYRTTNGGEEWLEQNLPVYKGFYSSCLVSGNLGWLTGEDGSILHTVDGGISWTDQTSGIKATLNGLCLINENNGWVAGVTGIYRTDNGGHEWDLQTQGWFNDIFFTSTSRGWAVGPLGKIVNTADGGVTWNVQQTETSEYLLCVFFNDNQHGWITGRNGTILATIDGGVTWEQQTSNTTEDLNSIDFANATTGWAVGDYGKLLHTTDGGEHWSFQTIPPPIWNSLTCVFALNDQVAWVSSYHEVMFTEDGGENWVMLAEDISPSIHSIFFLDQTYGYAVGNSGHLIYTNNGGHSWNNRNSGTGQDLTAVWFTDPDHGWITGIDGTILHKDGDEIVRIPEQSKYNQESGLKVYPNPFSGFTNIEFFLDVPGFVSIQIINSLGQQQFTQKNYYQKGSCLFKWNPEGLLPGIYFYRIIINDKEYSGKVIRVSIDNR